jgi:hypothetical protein
VRKKPTAAAFFSPRKVGPHHGFRLGNKIRDEDINRRVIDHHNLLVQLLGQAENIINHFPSSKAKDARGTHYIMTTVEGGPLARLSQTWLYPAAEF